MLKPELLKILVCPETRAPLELADAELIERVNRAIARAQVKNKAGRTLTAPVEGGLTREDRSILYPIVDEIPMLLVDEAIQLDQVDGAV